MLGMFLWHFFEAVPRTQTGFPMMLAIGNRRISEDEGTIAITCWGQWWIMF
jgi:hypothetical protein